ncbi:MAG: PqqD family peptide modification chaperone [Sphingomicrobium sp.]
MPDTVYSRTSKIIATEIGDILVALDRESGMIFELNAIAASVWRNLEQPRTFAQLRDALIAKYDVPADRCAAELGTLLDQLSAKALVEELVGQLHLDTERADAGFPKAATEALAKSNEDDPWQFDGAPEFALVVRCCRWTFAGGVPAELEIPPGFDWPLFLRLIRFHRVQGLVWNCLSKTATAIPPDVAEAISSEAIALASTNLRAAVEALELLALARSVQVPALLVKGLALGARAYPNAAVKASIDIDLLVAAEQLEQVAGLLRERGYRLQSPAGSSTMARLRTWHEQRKESTWSKPGLQVDLHTRLADNPRMIPSIGLGSPTQEVPIFGGLTLPTLADEELFSYLAVHGASSAWFRLKWITDFAAFIHRLGEGAIEPIYRRSQELGAGRAADQALLLADHFYGTLKLNKPLARQLKNSRTSDRLFRLALAEIVGRDEPVEPTDRFLGTAAIHGSQLLLRPGAGFAAGELVRQVRALLS